MGWRLAYSLVVRHIMPVKCFDLSNIDGIRAYWALSNLRPMWARDNLRNAGSIQYLV